MNKLQWNFNQNSCISIQENAFENVVCKMVAICLCLNVLRALDYAMLLFSSDESQGKFVNIWMNILV